MALFLPHVPYRNDISPFEHRILQGLPYQQTFQTLSKTRATQLSIPYITHRTRNSAFSSALRSFDRPMSLFKGRYRPEGTFAIRDTHVLASGTSSLDLSTFFRQRSRIESLMMYWLEVNRDKVGSNLFTRHLDSGSIILHMSHSTRTPSLEIALGSFPYFSTVVRPTIRSA